MIPFLDQYDPLDIIGNGSFGIIRKVRRKSDGMVFARKELNFERMTERDRKQIVAEVNILKDLHHDHIVRYHDRYVDRDAGILYILMEYCGGGDLSTVIKQATRSGRPIPEDTIWSYFMQILLALQHCHHPNGHSRSSSGNGLPGEEGGNHVKERRVQILHRDLKPDNVFLDESHVVKLGDFGLSKALAQSSFANTYVGTPYYMSPELMQEKAYDSKSDIWSLGCLIYELCALKPPFHEAKTHNELSISIRNGRIPPLPRGYSQSLSAVIKAMLNLNPAMRPSAVQLLQHERLELSFRVSETDKLLSQVKNHRAAVLAKEREVVVREESLRGKEQRITAMLAEKDAEISRLHAHVSYLQQQPRITQRDVEIAMKQAVVRREEELRVLIQRREEEVASAMTKREKEIMEAVRMREAEVCRAWTEREAEIRNEVEVSIKAVQQRVEWISKKEDEIRNEEDRIEEMKEELEEKMRAWEASQKAGKSQKAPLEEVKNILEPITRMTNETPTQRRRQPRNHNQATPKQHETIPFPLQTPITRPNYTDTLPSAMKGVILTTTGETLATPSPNELAKLFNQSPKVGLGFTKILESPESEFERPKHLHQRVDELRLSTTSTTSEEDVDSPPPSPSERKERELKEKERYDSDNTSSNSTSSTGSAATISIMIQSESERIRKSSIPAMRAANIARSQIKRSSSTIASSSKPVTTVNRMAASAISATTTLSAAKTQASRVKPVPVPVPKNGSAPEYNLADEENLPSPFLKRVDREKVYGKVVSSSTASSSSSSSSAAASTSTAAATTTASASAPAPTSGTTTINGGSGRAATKKRPSTAGGNYLRAMAAANVVGKRSAATSDGPTNRSSGTGDEEKDKEKVGVTRSAVVTARKAGEEARKALSRS